MDWILRMVRDLPRINKVSVVAKLPRREIPLSNSPCVIPVAAKTRLSSRTQSSNFKISLTFTPKASQR